MTQTDDPTSLPAPVPRRRRWWPSVLLGLLSLLLLLIGLGHSMGGHHECCAIDCTAYPESCERRAREHRKMEENATKMAFAGFAGSAIALGTAVVLLRRG